MLGTVLSSVAVQGQCSTGESKRRQILLLVKAVYNVNMVFKKRFLPLEEMLRLLLCRVNAALWIASAERFCCW